MSVLVGSEGLAGTATLLRLWAARDRIVVPAWVFALCASLGSTASAYRSLYGTREAVHEFATGVGANGSTLALYGRIHAESIGGLTAWRMSALGAALAGVMSIFLVVRHTRAEEETGRLELLGATALGRQAPLTAGLLVAAVANALLGAAAFGVLVAAGLPVVGSLALGLAWACGGLVFAALAGLTVQLTEHARTARGLALAVLGAAYLLRAVGDAGPGWLSWTSPLGWASLVRPYAAERWWVLALPLVLAAALTVAGYALSVRRDHGAGLLPSRLGPATGTLAGTSGLAWRLQRGSLLGWAAGLAGYGLAVGGLADGIAGLVESSSGTRDIITRMGGQGSLTDAFLATTFQVTGLFAAGYALQSALRLRGEETGQRLEPLLASAEPRLRWALGHLAVTFGGVLALVGAAGLAAGAVHAARTGDAAQIPRLFTAALAQAPAAWVLAGAAVLLFGLLPRASQAAWALLAACLVLTQLGPALDLPAALTNLSPFTHSPKLPGPHPWLEPTLWLTTTALTLTTAGLTAFRHRDVTT